MEKLKKDSKEITVGHLIGIIGRLNSRHADRFIERIGLYRGQAILLIVLSENEGLTHSEMAEKLEISPAAVTKVIKRLEKLNYLQRRSDPSDERISRIFLKEEGWAVIQKIRKAFQQIDNALLRNLSPEEQNTLIKLLTQVYDNLLNQLIEPPEYKNFFDPSLIDNNNSRR